MAFVLLAGLMDDLSACAMRAAMHTCAEGTPGPPPGRADILSLASGASPCVRDEGGAQRTCNEEAEQHSWILAGEACCAASHSACSSLSENLGQCLGVTLADSADGLISWDSANAINHTRCDTTQSCDASDASCRACVFIPLHCLSSVGKVARTYIDMPTSHDGSQPWLKHTVKTGRRLHVVYREQCQQGAVPTSGEVRCSGGSGHALPLAAAQPHRKCPNLHGAQRHLQRALRTALPLPPAAHGSLPLCRQARAASLAGFLVSRRRPPCLLLCRSRRRTVIYDNRVLRRFRMNINEVCTVDAVV